MINVKQFPPLYGHRSLSDFAPPQNKWHRREPINNQIIYRRPRNRRERIFPMIQQKEAAVIGGVIYISSSRVINPERVGVVIATCFELS